MSWTTLFERASEHETTTETIRATLAAVRAHGVDDPSGRNHDG